VGLLAPRNTRVDFRGCVDIHAVHFVATPLICFRNQELCRLLHDLGGCVTIPYGGFVATPKISRGRGVGLLAPRNTRVDFRGCVDIHAVHFVATPLICFRNQELCRLLHDLGGCVTIPYGGFVATPKISRGRGVGLLALWNTRDDFK